MAESTIRSLRPDVVEWQDWRVGKITAIGASATVRVRIASGFIRNKTVATSSLPSGAAVGAPLACRISSSHPDTSTVLEVAAAPWCGNEPRNEASDIGNDGRWPVIPRSITGAPIEWWSA
jgi:hypothetical protein